MNDFHAMQAEILAATEAKAKAAASSKKAKAQAKTVYLVAAWFGRLGSPKGYWKIFRETHNDDYLTIEAAQYAATRLSRVWTNRKIIKLEFPAEERKLCP